jgi:hypothetical protein
MPVLSDTASDRWKEEYNPEDGDILFQRKFGNKM